MEEEGCWRKGGRKLQALPDPRHPSVSIQDAHCLNRRERSPLERVRHSPNYTSRPPLIQMSSEFPGTMQTGF